MANRAQAISLGAPWAPAQETPEAPCPSSRKKPRTTALSLSRPWGWVAPTPAAEGEAAVAKAMGAIRLQASLAERQQQRLGAQRPMSLENPGPWISGIPARR